MAAVVFWFGAFPVGTFAADAAPVAPGRHAYLPLEGPGDAHLQDFRRLGGSPLCHYDAGGERVSFTVRDRPRYGLLDLADFATGPVPETGKAEGLKAED